MRVELHIDGNLSEPYARICAQRITPALQAAMELLEREGERAWLMGQKAGKHFVLDPGQVEILRTEGRELALYDANGERYTVSKPLYELQEWLGREFVRISKSALIRLRSVHHVEPSFNGTMEVVMKNGVKEVITRSYRQEFKARLGV